MKIPSLPLAVLVLAAVPAHAAITYLDAEEGASGNTFATGGSLADTSWMEDPGTSSGNETQWGKRAFTNDATVFQALHETVTSDDMPELTTRITGLADGTYELWVFYWDQVVSDTQNWIISAGLTPGALTSFSSPGEPTVAGTTKTGVVNAGTLDFTNSVLVEEGGGLRNMFGVNLGQVTISGGSAANIYVDNLIGGGSGTRAWFDGVGYELVPEPTSTALLSLGALALMRRRRK